MRALAILLIMLAGCTSSTIDWPEKTDAACSGAEPGLLTCTVVATGFTSTPVQAIGAGDAVYVAVQEGLVYTLHDGVVSQEFFLDIRDRVSTCHFEQGLLGLAFPPGFDGDGDVFVSYTAKQSCESDDLWKKGDLILSRFRAVDGRVNAASEEIHLTIPEPYRNHNGGHLAFGPDGMLYLGVGDGGDADDPMETGRDPSDLLGSILRIDVLSGPSGYWIPHDNPWGHDNRSDDHAPEVYVYGLRNPWRFSFHGDELWIADVGQDCFEEINVVTGGGHDLGWSDFEGRHRFDADADCPVVPASDLDGTVAPVYQYGRDQGCSITGGMHSPASWGGLGDMYLFGDFCNGTIWGLRATESGYEAEVLLQSGLQITAFGQAGDTIYVLHWGGSLQTIAPS